MVMTRWSTSRTHAARCMHWEETYCESITGEKNLHCISINIICATFSKSCTWYLFLFYFVKEKVCACKSVSARGIYSTNEMTTQKMHRLMWPPVGLHSAECKYYYMYICNVYFLSTHAEASMSIIWTFKWFDFVLPRFNLVFVFSLLLLGNHVMLTHTQGKPLEIMNLWVSLFVYFWIYRCNNNNDDEKIPSVLRTFTYIGTFFFEKRKRTKLHSIVYTYARTFLLNKSISFRVHDATGVRPLKQITDILCMYYTYTLYVL